jgi:hypothetical protein
MEMGHDNVVRIIVATRLEVRWRLRAGRRTAPTVSSFEARERDAIRGVQKDSGPDGSGAWDGEGIQWPRAGSI